MLEQETEGLSFGARLRAARERRHISIAAISDKTKILAALLEGLENNDVSRWPLTGFYRRAFIRAYAVAIGLDPDPVVREFVARFPVPEDTLIAPAVNGNSAPAISTPGQQPPLRLTLAERPLFGRLPVARTLGMRLRAIALDALVLSAIGLMLFAVFESFWAPFGVAAALYYFSAILFLGNTPGVWLTATRAHRARHRSRSH